MYHNLTVPEQCIALWQECQSLTPQLLQDCQVKTRDLIINSDNPIDTQSRSLYLIRDGDIFETYDGQLIVIYEKGDLLNADGLSRAKLTAYATDFPVTVDEYDRQQFIDAIAADKIRFETWNRYLSCLSQSYQLLVSHFCRQDTEYLPEFREYNKGDIIIQEGTEGDEVFMLLSGTAKAISNNEEVGEIHKDEIFGAIAALTNTRRTATIVATSDCDTLVARGENFRSILETRPDIIHKLIQDMARTIVSSNEKIIELSRDRA